MKRQSVWIIATLVLAMLMGGCARKEIKKEKVVSDAGDGKKNVTVTTSFLADMVRVIAGDTVNVEVIIPAGEDPHLYVAKSSDLDKLKRADLVLYHGLHFEGKMNAVLEELGKAVTADFPKDKIGRFDQDGEIIDDPHFWFDVDLYGMAVEAASKYLQELVPSEAKQYAENTEKYKKELKALGEECREMLATIPKENRYLITPHDAFNYFSRYFDIPVMAPQGVSTDTEVAVADMEKTADFIAEHKVKAIFSESTTNPERMKALQEAVRKKGFDVEVVSGENEELFSDSLAPKGHPGDTYLDMMRHNVKLIVDHLK